MSEVLTSTSQPFKLEMAGIIRYLHYSFMIMGHHRIPIQKWLRDQASEGMTHTTMIGEKITAYGGHPPMLTESIKESNVHSIDQILKESMTFEEAGLELYEKLAQLAADAGDIALEEMARAAVLEETTHLEEVRKMLRRPV